MVGSVLRLHDRVAGFAAELDRLHDLDTLVGRAGQDDDVQHRRPDKDGQPAAGLRRVEVEDRHFRHMLVAVHTIQLASEQECADRNQHQPDDEDDRQDQVRQDPEIRTALESHPFHEEQAYHQHEARDRDA